MNIKSASLFFVLAFFSNSIMAFDECYVIGFHEPNTHVYDGPTFCNKASLLHITVHGPLKIKESVVQGEVNVSGPVDASHAEMGSIQIQKQITTQKVILRNQSKIDRNIIFTGQPGVVLKSTDSLIIGKVINGAVETIRN